MPTLHDLSPLLGHPWSRALRAAADGWEVHLVGGAIRDACLSARQVADVDATVDRQAEELARRLQEVVPARRVVLGKKEHAALRLVPRDASLGDLDLWDRQGGTLHADLERRDFTVHAVAVEVRTGEVVDPFHGLADIDRRVLRDTTTRTLFEDPQRTVRLVRLIAQLPGFTIDPATRRRAIEASQLLSRVAAERIATELGRWTRQDGFPAGARVLADLAPFGAVALSLDALDRLASLLGAHGLPSGEPREEAIWGTIQRRAAGSFEDWVGRGWVVPEVARAIDRQRAAGAIPTDEPARREWIHRLGRTWRAAAAAELAALEPEAAHQVMLALTSIAEDESLFAVRGLISGEDLRQLGIPSGPALGTLLTDLRRREVRGELGDREQALRLARDRWRRITSASSGAD